MRTLSQEIGITNAPVDIRGQLLGIDIHKTCVLSVNFLVIQQEIKK
jgi:hypothetical protein